MSGSTTRARVVAEPQAAVVSPAPRAAWDAAIEDYFAAHDSVGTDSDARGPDMYVLERTGRRWPVRQTLADPAGHHDWVIEAEADVDASDELGELVLVTTAMRRL